MKEQDTQSAEEKAAAEKAEADKAAQAKALGEEKGPEEEPKITEAEAKTRVEKAVQAARIQAGRDNKTLDLRKAALDKREEVVAQEEKDRRETAREAVRDDAEALKTLDAIEAVRAREREVAKKEAAVEARGLELEADKEARAEETLINAIADVATEFELDATKFAKSCTDLKLTSREQVESLARTVTGKEPDTKGKKKPLITDSSKGGGGSPSEEAKLKARYPSMFKNK